MYYCRWLCELESKFPYELVNCLKLFLELFQTHRILSERSYHPDYQPPRIKHQHVARRQVLDTQKNYNSYRKNNSERQAYMQEYEIFPEYMRYSFLQYTQELELFCVYTGNQHTWTNQGFVTPTQQCDKLVGDQEMKYLGGQELQTLVWIKHPHTNNTNIWVWIMQYSKPIGGEKIYVYSFSPTTRFPAGIFPEYTQETNTQRN